MALDPLQFTARWRVRQYEVDSQGHLNNAVYLNYAEELAARHAEACGYGRAWSKARGGRWVIRRHEIDYHLPCLFGDELELRVQVLLVRGARGQRRTTVRRLPEGVLAASIFTEWVWVRATDGRPAPAPAELVAQAASATALTLERRRGRARLRGD
ncbi:MAG: acyl-CoA thioesterase [Candidatus Dormibacteria bacterium]